MYSTVVYGLQCIELDEDEVTVASSALIYKLERTLSKHQFFLSLQKKKEKVDFSNPNMEIVQNIKKTSNHQLFRARHRSVRGARCGNQSAQGFV
jgi:hypothetical protein